jgi:EmrB/QacA subfamily drug resistance transporter
VASPVGIAAGLRVGEPAGRWVLAATVLGSGLAMLDATVVNVALARVGVDLGGSMAGLQWVLNGYTLTLAAFILLGGSLSDRFGRRRIFVLGATWFAIASAVCALAPSIGLLIAARAVQGIGGALLTPGSLAILSASFRPEDRSRAIGAWSGLGGLAGALGPFLGGWLLAVGTWRLVFLINLPLAAAVVAVALRHVPESRDPSAKATLDITGTVLGVVGLAAVTYACTAAGDRGWTGVTPAVAGAGVLSLLAFVVHLRRSAAPLVPPALFASRQFTAANLVTFCVYAALGVVFFLLVLDLQVTAGFSPLLAGTTMLPVTALMLLLSARSGALAQRIGPRLQLTVGPLIAAAGLLLTLRVGAGASYLVDVLPAVALFGLGLATLVAPLTAAVLTAAPVEAAGIASGVNNAVARTAGLLAVAVVPALSGLGGGAYRSAPVFAVGYRTATLVEVGLLIGGSLLAALGIRDRPPPAGGPGAVPPAAADRLVHRLSCPVDGPRLETIHRIGDGS